MTDMEQVTAVLEELIEILHLQSKELEELVAHVEQVTPRLGYSPQLSVIRSGLSALHLRVKRMREEDEGPAG